MWVILTSPLLCKTPNERRSGRFGQEPQPCHKDACIAPLSAPCISLPCSAAWTNRRRRLCRERAQTSRGLCCCRELRQPPQTALLPLGSVANSAGEAAGLMGYRPAPVRALLVPVSLVGRCWCMPCPTPLISQKDFPEFW